MILVFVQASVLPVTRKKRRAMKDSRIFQEPFTQGKQQPTTIPLGRRVDRWTATAAIVVDNSSVVAVQRSTVSSHKLSWL